MSPQVNLALTSATSHFLPTHLLRDFTRGGYDLIPEISHAAVQTFSTKERMLFHREHRHRSTIQPPHARGEDEATHLMAAKNEAHREVLVCLQVVRAYLNAADPTIRIWTWQTVMETMGESKQGSTHKRWITAYKDRAFDLITTLPRI